ncbi:MAG TPA: prepilin-type N-terminal cleavage/methylation domain-containing protein [Chthoniobacter sp.]|jgi:hypothetical protein
MDNDNPKTVRRSQAFTLLEMILALMITSMTVLTLYHFVSVQLTAIQVSSELSSDRETLDTVVHFLRAQLNTVPPGDDGTLVGKALKFHGLSSDEITWRCPGGDGVLTTAAPGYYFATLTVQPVSSSSTETELGLRRQTVQGNTTSIDLGRGGAGGHYNWLPLVRPMAALEIRYFDGNAHTWVENWSDALHRPPLVRVRLWRHADDPPLEAVFDVPASRILQ